MIVDDWNDDDLNDVLARAQGQRSLLLLKERGTPGVTNITADWPVSESSQTGRSQQ